MKISQSININSSPEKIFNWLEDPAKAQQWMTNVTNYKIINATPNKIDTTFIEIVEENARQLELHGKITAFDPNKKIAFHLESKVHTVDVDFSLIGMKNGILLTQSADIHFKGFMKILIFLFGLIFKRKINDQIKYEFSKLKKLCEGSENE